MSTVLLIPDTKHDPGGKVLTPCLLGYAVLQFWGGEKDEYRYERDEDLATLLFVMMNPSTAGPDSDDPSVAKCRRYAEDGGFGSLLVGNTFAYRATDKKRLLEIVDPVGPDNDAHLLSMADRAAMIVFAYGQPDEPLRYRGLEVARLLSREGTRPIHALRLAQDGTPWHPLYLPVLIRDFYTGHDGRLTCLGGTSSEVPPGRPGSSRSLARNGLSLAISHYLRESGTEAKLRA